MAITSRAATIDLSKLKTSKPTRSVSAVHVTDLVKSLGPTGFATSVVVRAIEGEEGYYEVVTGHHRVAAAKQAGLTEIHVIIVEGASDIELALIAIDENVLRRPLTAAQEARALAQRKEMYQTLHPSTRRGGDRRSNHQSGSLNFAAATAAATGRSETAVNRAVARAEKITDGALNAIQGTHLETGDFMDCVAKVPRQEQEAYVAAALAKPSEPIANQIDVEGDLHRLRRCWAQTCEPARKQFLIEVNGSKKAAGGT